MLVKDHPSFWAKVSAWSKLHEAAENLPNRVVGIRSEEEFKLLNYVNKNRK